MNLKGGISALPTAVIMVPSERIKCILQTRAKVGWIKSVFWLLSS